MSLQVCDRIEVVPEVVGGNPVWVLDTPLGTTLTGISGDVTTTLTFIDNPLQGLLPENLTTNSYAGETSVTFTGVQLGIHDTEIVSPGFDKSVVPPNEKADDDDNTEEKPTEEKSDDDKLGEEIVTEIFRIIEDTGDGVLW